ncbi:hypothetical protein MCERE1_00399 [Burkholderiaceae bacterium]
MAKMSGFVNRMRRECLVPNPGPRLFPRPLFDTDNPQKS